MFLSKTNCCLTPKFLGGYVHNYDLIYKRGKECLYILETCSYSINAKTNTNQLSFPLSPKKNGFNERDTRSMQIKGNRIQWSSFSRKFCTKHASKDANMFGDLSYEKYEKVEMDEAEKEEERFTENEARIPRWQKLSPGQYSKLIISHISKGDLKLALSVLDLVKQNRDKPTVYMYSLLIRSFALQGDIKQCFKLYNKMKKHQLIPNAAIYNSLINVCAISKDTNSALEHLHSLREFFYGKNYILNQTHYITLIKAYSWHKQTTTALEIADEAKDKGFLTHDIYAALFHAAISDKMNGLKYALILWHKMRINKIAPNLTHYNLLLRAIRDTKFGDMNDTLILKSLDTQIQIDKVKSPDLLDFPPRLNTSLFALNKKSLQSEPGNAICTKKLNDMLNENRLILFGGIRNILQRMESDNVTPDIKTVTLLLELLPSSIPVEEFFLQYVNKKGIKLDICFFNLLIKRRSLRDQYKQAKDVLYEAQRRHLLPDIMTFGTLAIGCKQIRDGIELLEQMNSIRFVPNSTILDTLMQNATSSYNFPYVKYLMDYILNYELKLSEGLLNNLEQYQTSMLKLIKTKNRYNRKEIKKIQNDYNNFMIIYDEWKKNIQKEDILKMSRPSTS